ncbi:MAG: 50S ribosomal protein L17 [Deltaproteobacteria bacterium]|nr:50S ribosomal protein L17 [Deltaproteobacteria bacterium]
MRHRYAGRKLNVTTSHRIAMLRNMVTSLFEHERIVTTDARAKELRILADRMVTLAKRGDLHARRQALAVIRSKSVAAKLFDEIGKRFAERMGGYVRVIKKGNRVGDGAPISIVELVTESISDEKKKKGKKKRLMGRLARKKKEETSVASETVQESGKKPSAKTEAEPEKAAPVAGTQTESQATKPEPEQQTGTEPAAESTSTDAGGSESAEKK